MIHIYFHKDFDGICSAAVFARYVRYAITRKRPRFIGVDYELKNAWADRTLQRPSAIVDFLYHPDAEWWFDHHQTTFVRKDWELAYPHDNKHVWRTSYKSCPRLIIDSLTDSAIRCKLAERFSEYLEWSDVIDSANYASPQQVIECVEPALQINSTLSQDRSPEYLRFLIKAVGELSLGEVAALKPIQVRYLNAREWQERAIAYVRRVAIVRKQVAFIDLARHAHLFHRYAVYYLWPEVAYQVALYKAGREYKLTVASNPWIQFRGPDLGALCEQYGGGGHPVVAGVIVKSRKRALRISEEICKILRGEMSFHQQLSFGHAVQANLARTNA